MDKEKKPFFLKKWSDQLFGWVDKTLFNLAPEDNQGDSIAVPAWLTFLIGIGCGLVIAVLQTFLKNGEKVSGIFGSVVAILALGLVVYFIVRNLPFMKETGPKIARSAVMLILCALTFGLGVMIGVWGFILLVIVVVGWIVLKLIGGGSSSGDVKLSDGSVLKKKHNLTGDAYYEDKDGNTYQKNIDGSFTRE